MFKRLSEKFSKNKETVIWDKKDDDPQSKNREIIFRFPNADVKNFDKIKNVGVRGYERAIIYKNGISEGTLTGGLYEVEKDYRNASTEIVWFDTGEVMYNWGVGFLGGLPPLTKDGYKIGGNGEFAVKIFDPEILIGRLVVGKPNFNDKDIKKSINGEIAASYRNLVNKFLLKDLVTSDKDDINLLFKTLLTDRLKSLGLELLTMTIQGLAHPPEDKGYVDDILGDQGEQIRNIKDRIKKIKKRIGDLDDEYLDENISEEDYNSKMDRFNKMLKKYQNELKELEK